MLVLVACGGEGGRAAPDEATPGSAAAVVADPPATAIPPNILLDGHESRVETVAFSRDGSRLVTGSYDQRVRVWDVAAAAQIGVLDQFDGVQHVALNRDGTRGLSASRDTTKLWEVAPDGNIAVVGVLAPEQLLASPLALAFTEDGVPLAASRGSPYEPTLRLWNVETRQMLSEWPLTRHAVKASFDGRATRLVAASSDGDVWAFDLATRALLLQRPELDRSITSLTMADDGRSIAFDANNDTLVIVDVAGGAVTHSLFHEGQARQLVLSPDGALLAAFNGGRLRVWELASGGEPALFERSAGSYSGIAASPAGGRFATGHWDGAVVLWNMEAALTLLRSGNYVPPLKVIEPDPPNECLPDDEAPRAVAGMGTLSDPTTAGGNEYIAPVDFALDSIVYSSEYLTYCYTVTNPPSSSGGVASIEVPLVAVEGAPGRLLPSTGPSRTFYAMMGRQPDVPTVDIGPISPSSWEVYLDRDGNVMWNGLTNGGLWDVDTIPAGTSVPGFGMRSTALPGLREVSAEPTMQACCSEPWGTPEQNPDGVYPSPSQFIVRSTAVGPRHRADEMTLDVVREQLDAACGEIRWITDPATCDSLRSQLETAISAAGRSDGAAAATALEGVLSLLGERRVPRGDVSDNAYWMLRTNAEYVLARVE